MFAAAKLRSGLLCRTLRACLLLAPAALIPVALVPAALAQGGHGNRGGGLGPVSQFRDHSEESAAASPRASEMRSSGLHLAPPGRWWDDDRTVRTLGLNTSQQKRMDDVFAENRVRLLELYKGLDRELIQLDRLGRARTLDEAQIDTQIERVNQVRSDLEKAIAHYQLQLRKEMTTDQTVRMDGLRAEPQAAQPAPPVETPQTPQQAPSETAPAPKP